MPLLIDIMKEKSNTKPGSSTVGRKSSNSESLHVKKLTLSASLQKKKKAKMAGSKGNNFSDPYTPNNDLRNLYPQFVPWVWDICNQTLGRPGDTVNAFGRSKDRLSALRLALPQFKHYPHRPLTPSVERLKAVLARAPRPVRDASGKINIVASGPGIRILVPDIDCSPDEVTASWGGPYRKELLDALNAVVDQHGLGDEGWKSVRWEVYDKVGIQLSRFFLLINLQWCGIV